MYLTSKCQAPSYQNWNHMEMHFSVKESIQPNSSSCYVRSQNMIYIIL